MSWIYDSRSNKVSEGDEVFYRLWGDSDYHCGTISKIREPLHNTAIITDSDTGEDVHVEGEHMWLYPIAVNRLQIHPKDVVYIPDGDNDDDYDGYDYDTEEDRPEAGRVFQVDGFAGVEDGQPIVRCWPWGDDGDEVEYIPASELAVWE